MTPQIEVHAFKADPTHSQAIVTLKFASPTTDNHAAYYHLRSHHAVNLALAKAAQEGLSNPGTTNFPGVYPVDAAGERITDAAKQPIADWRCDVAVMKKLV